MKIPAIVWICLSLLLTSCTGGHLGNILQAKPSRPEHLSHADLLREEAKLSILLNIDPENASTQHAHGRVLLALEQPRRALISLKKAVDLNENNADYQFWLGVAYAENGQASEEQVWYMRALQDDPQHVPALVNLGNNYLKRRIFQPALNCYLRALAIDPSNAQALYNRAVIYNQLQQTAEEKLAWKLYLEAHPSGVLARKAVDHLNLLNDFSYRNHYLGRRVLTLPAITYTPFSAGLTQSDRTSLRRIGSVAVNFRGALNILVYQKNGKLARNRAIGIKAYLEQVYPVLAAENRIRISWFDVPEKKIVAGHIHRIDDSTVFFLAVSPRKPIKLNKKGKIKR